MGETKVPENPTNFFCYKGCFTSKEDSKLAFEKYFCSVGTRVSPRRVWFNPKKKIVPPLVVVHTKLRHFERGTQEALFQLASIPTSGLKKLDGIFSTSY